MIPAEVDGLALLVQVVLMGWMLWPGHRGSWRLCAIVGVCSIVRGFFGAQTGGDAWAVTDGALGGAFLVTAFVLRRDDRENTKWIGEAWRQYHREIDEWNE